ncbi:anti-sigma factor family protein [Thermoflavifilum thermophilum]|uniref:Uncharacterized protein n=1 Tax=Thermoflavifilum thermophilum TaxID=1393122 RepID=A0A1I7N9E7_9BACT|nr:hypothetical protein [Thermoflavifilum thermophilum]SFV31166.1 hypothetical protein SAMN05660895_0998 [Thermoflavifilum thermophilum]
MNSERLEELMIRALDDELSKEEWKELQAYLAAHPELQAEWEKWQLTRLPAETCTYPDKQQLYRHSRKRMKYLYGMAAAACIAGLWILGKMFMSAIHPVSNWAVDQPQVSTSAIFIPKEEKQKSDVISSTTRAGIDSFHHPHTYHSVVSHQPIVSKTSAKQQSLSIHDTVSQETIMQTINIAQTGNEADVLPLDRLAAITDLHAKADTSMVINNHKIQIHINSTPASNAADAPVLLLSARSPRTFNRIILAVARTVDNAHKIQESLFASDHIRIELQQENH